MTAPQGTGPTLGERVRAVLAETLEAQRLGLPDLAARSGLPLTYLAALWSDPGSMSTADLADLAAALDLDPGEVLDRADG